MAADDEPKDDESINSFDTAAQAKIDDAEVAAASLLTKAATLAREVLVQAATTARALITATPASGQNAPQPPAAPAGTSTFSLGPGDKGETLPVDYSCRAGQHLYGQACKPQDPKYDGKEEGLAGFLLECKSQSGNWGWKTVTSFHRTFGTSAQPPELMDLFTTYGDIELAELQSNALGWAGQESRDAQLSHRVHEYGSKSLTSAFRTRVELQPEKYTVAGAIDGACYIKTIIDLVNHNLDDVATRLRHKLQPEMLRQTLKAANFNIDDFSTEVL
jgi:hypothetical protein